MVLYRDVVVSGINLLTFSTSRVELSINGSVGLGSWVKRVNKFGWVTGQYNTYSLPADPFYTVLVRFLMSFSGSLKQLF